jgi:HAE1 family hydrophobic/amphiphilic exporter-1
MQWLASISVKRPVFATVIILSLTVVGAFSFGRLGLDRFPFSDRRRDHASSGRRA